MIRYCFLLSLVFLSTFVMGQMNYRVQLVVTDSSGHSVEDALVLLQHSDNGTPHYGNIKKGQARIQSLQEGPYTMTITSIPWKDTTLLFQLKGDTTLNITLSPAHRILKETSISTTRNTFTVREGNLKAQVEHTLLSTLPDVMEVLAKIPTVQVSNDRESVSVLGKGTPLIYLGNQRISWNELSMLAVNDIKSIEVLHNPSSKYEGEGRAVILITRRVNSNSGSTMDVTETASMKRRFENRFNVNAANRRGRNEWKINLQYNYITRWEGLQGYMLSESNKYESSFNGTSIGLRQQWVGSIGYFRSLKNNDYFSINIGGRWQDEFPIIHTTSLAHIQNQTQDIHTQAVNYQNRPYATSSINYQKTLKGHGGKIFFGGQASNYSRTIRNSIYNNPQNTTYSLSEKRNQAFDIQVFVARMDYSVIIRKKINLESGWIMNKASSNTNFDVNAVTPASNTHLTYRYQEGNVATYIQFSGTYSRWHWNAGTRLEQTKLKGETKGSSLFYIHRNFLFFLPKAGLSFKIDSLNSIQINYAASVRRPDYSSLNQTTNYITPFLERSNNVYINPSHVHEASVNYQCNNYSLRVSANYTKNPAYYITEKDSLTHNLRIINRNLKEEWGGNILLTLPFTYKIFTSTNTASLGVNQVRGNQAVIFPVKPFYYVSSNNQWKLKYRITFMANAWYASSKNEGVFKHNAQYAVDLSASKKWKDHWTFTLNAFDIFRSLNYRETFQTNDVYSNILYIENVREFGLSIKYIFGTNLNSKYKMKDVNDSGNRIN